MMTSTATTTINILLTGASGFLGQHLIDYWIHNHNPSSSAPQRIKYKITALYHSSENFPTACQGLSNNVDNSNVEVIPKSCNLVNYDDTSLSLDDMEKFDVCIHTAALSSPRECQRDPEKARALNVPLKFLQATKDIPIMIVMSTDQVYDGKQSPGCFYRENLSEVHPLNEYAKTKVELESVVQEIRCGDNSSSTATIIFRSSIILGPKAPISPQDAHDTFLHFCASRDKQETDLWVNEYRTVVSVKHVCTVIDWMVEQGTVKSKIHKGECHTFNLGGPIRVNRYDMATSVFQHFGYDTNVLTEAKQTSPTVPLDISMDSTKLEGFTGVIHQPTTLRGFVEYTFPSTSK